MAPPAESVYFPALSICLEAPPKLLSWKTVASDLDDSNDDDLNQKTAAHIQDPAAIDAFTSCFEPKKPNAQSKADVDKLIAGIKQEDETGRWNAKELKDDALWLSQAAQIDETHALRLTILEWQERSAGQTSLGSMSNETNDSCYAAKSRRQRLLDTYFTETQWLFRCTEIIVSKGIYGVSKLPDQEPHQAINAAATAISTAWKLSPLQSSRASKTWLAQITAHLQQQIDQVQSGSDFLTREDMQDYATEALHVLSTETSIVQVVHGLQSVLLVQWSSNNPTTPRLILDWFEWMDTTGFLCIWLSRLPLPFSGYKSQIIELVILCSLAFVDLATATEVLPDLSKASAVEDGQETNIFLQRVNCVQRLGEIIFHHVGLRNELAAPVGIAWCSLLGRIHTYAADALQTRENRSTAKAFDQFEQSNQSDTESIDSPVRRRRSSPQRRQSFSSDTSGPKMLFDKLDKLTENHPNGEDAIAQYGKSAVLNLGGFTIVQSIAQSSLARLDDDTSPELVSCIREILLQFIKACIELGSIQYSPPVLDIVFALLGARGGHWRTRIDMKTLPHPFQPPYSPLGDDPLLGNILSVARGRFPLEDVPFIELCRGLLPYQQQTNDGGDLVLEIISELQTFTSLVSEPQIPYELVGDGEDWRLHLLANLDALAMVFPDLYSGKKLLSNGPLCLPQGTQGQALKEEKPIIALWQMQYSGLRFCGLSLQLLLQTRARTRTAPMASDYTKLYLLATEIIGFFGTWLLEISSHGAKEAVIEKAESLLGSVSDDLDRNQDVVAVIFELLEGELYQPRPDAATADFVLRSIQFLAALAKIMPGRVWPYLSRSGLLGLHGQENRLMAIVTAVEMSSGTYDILITAVQLLDTLVEDSIRSLASRNQTSTALKRFRASGTDGNGNGVKDVTKKKILQQYSQILVNIIETSVNWRFQEQNNRLSLKLEAYRILHKIISYTYNYDDESSASSRLAADLEPAASYIVDNFLSETANDGLLQPFFEDLVDVATTAPTSLPSRVSLLTEAVASCSLAFVTQLIRLNTSLGRLTSHLTSKIREIVPVLVGLFKPYSKLRLPIVQVLDVAIRDVGSSQQAAPLLAALPEPSAKAFLQCLTTFVLPVADSNLSAAVWSLFTAAVMHKQQWLAVYVLSGKTPRESLKDKTPSKSSSAIQVALNRITKLETIPAQEAVKMLEFVAFAANLWTSVTRDLRNNKECRESCLKFLTTVETPKTNQDTPATTPLQFQIAAYIINILALLVNQANQAGDVTTLRHIIPSIKYLVDHGADSPYYNASLHHGLEKNFEGVFPGSTLQHFKRTALSNPTLGEQFYYDTKLADALLGHVQAWEGKAGRGFASEFARANINLSLVEAQVNVFHSWKFLVLELSEGLGDDTNFQTTIITIVKNCLEANQSSSMPEPIFKKLCVARADLAFALFQRLADIAPGSKEARGLLEAAWSSAQPSLSDVSSSLSGGDGAYTRTLLRILYLATCIEAQHTSHDKLGETTTEIALEVLNSIVAQGFRGLVGQLHDDASQVQPQDFSILIALLRACFEIPGVINRSEQLLAYFADERTIQHAGVLVSWADQLAANGDPIYGELSISFLLQLSTVQVLAEAIVIGGTYAQISSTSLFGYYRSSNGCGPFDHSPRLFNIWSQGYLPLTLNILGAIGAPVTVDIATLFGQFSPQLKRATTQFDPKQSRSGGHRVTLSMANEAHSLSLLHLVFNKFREAGSSVGIIPDSLPQLEWSASSAKEDIESLVARRHTLRETITPMDEQEANWFQQPAKDGKAGSQSRLEEKIVEEFQATLALLGGAE